jgi:PAS domain S-box-containing protein
MKSNKNTVVNAEARILDSMEDGFLRADTFGKIIMANRAIALMCGYASSEEMIGLHMKTLYANTEERDQLIKDIKEKNKLVNYELELKRKNGTTFWSLNNVKTFYDEEGNQLGTEGVIRDITEIRYTKEKLEHTNKVLASIRNVNKLITTEKEVPKLLQSICEILTAGKGYHNAWIMLLDEEGKFEAVYQTGLGKEFLEIASRLKKKFTTCALKTFELKEVISIANPVEDCMDCPLAKHYQDRGAMAAPIIHDNKLFGLITVSVPQKYLNKENLDL